MRLPLGLLQSRAGLVVITSTFIAVSRRMDILTGLGVAAATLTWATLAMLGLRLLAQLAWLTIAIRLAGAAYFIWTGCRMILNARRVGRQMVGAAETQLRQRGVVKAQLLLRETNTEAVAFYEHLGFQKAPRTIVGK